MARPASQHPTDLELEILKVIWRDGPCTVRNVRDALAVQGRELAYTSVMTVMTIMTRKRYLRRSKQGGGFLYQTGVAKQNTLGRMLRDLIDKAFGGSAAAAMLNLLETSDVDQRELRQIQDLISQHAGEKTTGEPRVALSVESIAD